MLVYIYDGLHRMPALCSQSLGFSVRKGRFWRSAASTTLNQSPKNFTGDYVGDPYSCAKFGATPSMSGVSENGWNI